MTELVSCEGCTTLQRNYDKLKATYCVLKQKIVYIDELMRLYLQKCAENDSLTNQVDELRGQLQRFEKPTRKSSRRKQNSNSLNDLEITKSPTAQCSASRTSLVDANKMADLETKLAESERSNSELRDHICSLETLLDRTRRRNLVAHSTQTDTSAVSDEVAHDPLALDRFMLQKLRDQLACTLGTLDTCLTTQDTREDIGLAESPCTSAMIGAFKSDLSMRCLTPLPATPCRNKVVRSKQTRPTASRSQTGSSNAVKLYTVGNTRVRICTRKRPALSSITARSKKRKSDAALQRPSRMARVSRVLSDAIGEFVDLDSFLLLDVDPLQPLDLDLHQDPPNTVCEIAMSSSSAVPLSPEASVGEPELFIDAPVQIPLESVSEITENPSLTAAQVDVVSLQSNTVAETVSTQCNAGPVIVSPKSATSGKSPKKKLSAAQKRRERQKLQRDKWKQFEVTPENNCVSTLSASQTIRSAVSASAVDLSRKFIKLLDCPDTRSNDRMDTRASAAKGKQKAACSPCNPAAKWFTDLATVPDDVLSTALKITLSRTCVRSPTSSLFSSFFIKAKSGIKHHVASCSQQPLLTAQETFVLELLGNIPRTKTLADNHTLIERFRAVLQNSVFAAQTQTPTEHEERCSLVRLFVVLCRRNCDLSAARSFTCRLIAELFESSDSSSELLLLHTLRFAYLTLSSLAAWPAVLDKRSTDVNTVQNSASNNQQVNLSQYVVEAAVCALRFRFLTALASVASDLQNGTNYDRLVRCYELLQLFTHFNVNVNVCNAKSQMNVQSSFDCLDVDLTTLCSSLKIASNTSSQNDWLTCKQLLNVFCNCSRPSAKQAVALCFADSVVPVSATENP